MTVTAHVTGGGIGGQRVWVSKAPPFPQHIKTTKGRGKGRQGVGECLCEVERLMMEGVPVLLLELSIEVQQ